MEIRHILKKERKKRAMTQDELAENGEKGRYCFIL